jgi:hypothetical protein
MGQHKREFGKRKFDGKYFTLPTENSWALKSHAKKQAEELREKGFKVRVVHRQKMNRYDVYKRR